MTQLGLLGIGLLVLSACMFLAHRSMKQTDQYSIRGLAEIYDRKSYPEFFEMWEKFAGASAVISLVAGLAILVTQLI